jgi:hypothetical protein
LQARERALRLGKYWLAIPELLHGKRKKVSTVISDGHRSSDFSESALPENVITKDDPNVVELLLLAREEFEGAV